MFFPQFASVKTTSSCVINIVRFASKKSGGSTKNGRKSAGKRLGIKKVPGSSVITGNILVRQRGLKFWPGEGTVCGRDHTIVASKEGKMCIHYDVITQRRYISIDDGTMPKELYPSRGIVKARLADSIDAAKYLSLDVQGRYDYVAQQIRLMKQEQDKLREEYIVKRVTENGNRKFNLVDLTLL